MKTAVEFAQEKSETDDVISDDFWYEAMIEFSKYHVKKALEQAEILAIADIKHVECYSLERAEEIANCRPYTPCYGGDGSMYGIDIAIVNKSSILNAYPPENIK